MVCVCFLPKADVLCHNYPSFCPLSLSLIAEGAGTAGSAGICAGPVLSPGTYQTPLSPMDLEVLKLHVATMQAYLDLCRGNAARALSSVEAVIASKAGPPQLLFNVTLYRAEALVRLGEF